MRHHQLRRARDACAAVRQHRWNVTSSLRLLDEEAAEFAPRRMLGDTGVDVNVVTKGLTAAGGVGLLDKALAGSSVGCCHYL